MSKTEDKEQRQQEQPANDAEQPRQEDIGGDVVDDIVEDVGGESDERTDSRREALKQAIREQAREDENPMSTSFTLRRILGGDFLTAAALRRYVGVILLVLAFIVIYISNRYSCEKEMIKIDALKKELQDAKYKALSSSSELTELCRESNVLKMLKDNPDSMLQIPKQPPYIIKIPKE